MKGNQYKKLHKMSEFERRYLCKKAKRNRKREEKRTLRKKVRKEFREELE